MLSKTRIENERTLKHAVEVSTTSMFTGTIDSWLTGANVVGSSTLTATPSVGLVLKAPPGVGNKISLKSGFGIVPRLYRRLRFIIVFDTVNCDFLTQPYNADLSIGLLNSDASNFVQILFHGNRGIRSRVNGVTSPEYPSMKPTDPSKRKIIEIVWDTDSNFIDFFENHIFIHRITGAELPDKAITYFFEMTIQNNNTANDKLAQIRKLWFQFET